MASISDISLQRAPKSKEKSVSPFWAVGAGFAAFLVVLPILAIIYIAFNPAENIWPHLLSTMLPRYVSNTAILMVGVGATSIVIGVATAWLVTMCRFPGQRLFEVILLLPLAMPAYVVAFVYTDFLEYAGPVQTLLRDIFGWQLKREYWFPDIRTKAGAIFVMGFVLYPYVYMLTRSAFLQQSVCVLEAGRVLGRGPWQSFFSVALPLARPAIVVGATLAMMETLNDFGTVDYFGVHTLTAGVYKTWLSMYNAGGAAQISLVMLAFVIGLLWMEKTSRRGAKYHETTGHYRALPGYPLKKMRAVLAIFVCFLPIFFGFLLPGGLLLGMALQNFDQIYAPEFWDAGWNSLVLSGSAAIITLMVGVFLAYALRLNRGNSKLLKILSRIASVGYAMPGAVLAIGIFIPFAAFDNGIDALFKGWFGFGTGLLLSGTAFVIIYAYVVRFMAIGFGGVESALGKVTTSMDDASRTLGYGPLQTLRLVHMPLIRGGILTAALLVFVDCMKELSATILLRPFNFETMATAVYNLASDELLEESALGALSIVIAGIIPVLLLSQTIRQSRPGHKKQFE